jgi:hypothetical protein
VEVKAPPHFLTQILNTTSVDEKMEHEIDVVSEGADTPTFASLHGQFADMNVVQEDTTTHEQSPKYTHPSISSLINHSEDEDNVRELKEKEVDAEDLDVDADVDGDLTGYAEQLVRFCTTH